MTAVLKFRSNDSRVARARRWAKPGVEAVGDHLTPTVESARERLRAEVLPRVNEAISAAGTASSVVAVAAAERAAVAAERAAQAVEAGAHSMALRAGRTSRRRTERQRSIVLGVLAGAVLAGYAAWRYSIRLQPQWHHEFPGHGAPSVTSPLEEPLPDAELPNPPQPSTGPDVDAGTRSAPTARQGSPRRP